MCGVQVLSRTKFHFARDKLGLRRLFEGEAEGLRRLPAAAGSLPFVPPLADLRDIQTSGDICAFKRVIVGLAGTANTRITKDAA